MQRMTPLEPSGDDDSPTYPLRQIVDTAQPQREQPMEPWGNVGPSGPLARPVSHRVPRGRRTAGNRSRRHPTAWPSNLPGACGTERFGELADPCGRDSQAVCLFPRHIRGLSKWDATAMGSTRPRQARASRTRCPCSSIPRAIAPSLADVAVDAFAQQVGVPAAPGVLLDPVYQQLLTAIPSFP